MITTLKVGIKKIVRDTIDISTGLYLSKPDVLINYGNSLGDDLLCTIVARQLKEKGVRKIWMKTAHPDLFLYNNDFDRIIDKRRPKNENAYLERFIRKSNPRIITPLYTNYIPELDLDVIPLKHIVHLMCDAASVSYPEIVKPHFFLTDDEKKQGRLAGNQVCVQSSGKGAKNYIGNKDWLVDRFSLVTSQLAKQYTVIQLGSASDDLLPGVIDMRGKTSIRQTASILYNAKFFIGNVGFLMHLARAVHCKSIIIFGGRERPDQTGYDVNENLYADVPCAPCWLRNSCLFNKKCMHQISVGDVLHAVNNVVEKDTFNR